MNNILLTMTVSKNFGDAISDILYTNLSNKNIIVVPLNCNKISYLTTGSVLRLSNENNIIIGTGFINENDDIGKGEWGSNTNNNVYKKPIKILSVRSPKTRKKLLNMGIECPKIYGDPLILLPLVYNLPVKQCYKIGVLPHYIDNNIQVTNMFVEKLQKKYTTLYIDNIKCGKNFKPLINNIRKCEYLISSSLHGIIMGIIYGKKTIFVAFSENVVGENFKFYDFFESININYDIPKYDDDNILDKYIKINVNNLINIGNDIINVCPFIENHRKEYLINEWKKYCDNNIQIYNI
jgi:pyruvyltransferase